MGKIKDHIPDPSKTLDLPGMSDEQLFQTMRNLVRFNQVDHYKAGDKPAGFLEIVGIIAIVVSAAFFLAAAVRGEWLMGLFF